MYEKRRERPTLLELESLLSIIRLQFSNEVSEIFINNNLEVERSPSTGRIRYVYINGKLVGSIRVQDGRFIPTIDGAKLILEKLPYPRKRVIVSEEAAPFIAEGKTVFCKHVIDLDPELRAGEEVLVIDPYGKLIALGKTVLAADEIKAKSRGKAVKIRRGTKKSI
ncbi:MAG TPA: pseudouridine synthase [Thermofilum sp.]|nr:pseudouridine synthase [Thermofilum sp.]